MKPLDRRAARAARTIALAATAAAALSVRAAGAQTADATALAARSPIVVSGTVTRVGASAEPLLAASPATVIVKIDRMLSGQELVGDQTGRSATIVLKQPGRLKAGSQALFFGNLRFAGKTITVVDEGEIPSQPSRGALTPAIIPAVARGVQVRRDAPVRARLAAANVVFRGTVESERPLEPTAQKDPLRDVHDEHDPEWHVASVRVTAALRGTQKGAVVAIVFPASQDIVWFNSPKLRPGQDVIVAAHRPTKDDLRLLQATRVAAAVEAARALLVTQPYDVLPGEQERRVTSLL